MYRQPDNLYDKNRKQIKVLYINDIRENDIDEEFKAFDMITNTDYKDFDMIVFKYKDGTSKRIDDKK